MRIVPLPLLLVGLAAGVMAATGATACRSSNEARPDPTPSSVPRAAPMPPSEQGAPLTTPPAAQETPAPPPPTASAAPSPSPSASGAAPAASGASALVPGHGRDGGIAAPGRACSADSDCRAFSDTCGDCTCRPLAKSATAPKCTRNQVQCFVDPCRGKRALCKAGACALNDDGAM